VATVRALKLHGGAAKSALGTEDVAAVRRGIANLDRHVHNMRKFGLPVVVALNKFTSDTAAEIEAVQAAMRAIGTEAILCTHWADGAAGATDLARAVQAMIAGGQAKFEPLYSDHVSLAGKIETVAREIYHASAVTIPPPVAAKLRKFEEAGFGNVPVCIAKTQYSFAADPTLMGAPEGHVLPLREVRLSAGAGFVVAICGEVMTMPGLPRRPAAEGIGLDAEGRIEGLF
jgi:formate--tetrahydrofolate ligase